jgi:hypothetical protein
LIQLSGGGSVSFSSLLVYMDIPDEKMSSIKNKDTSEPLKRKGMGRERAARISNAQKKK